MPARLTHGVEADLARPEGLEPIVVEGGECGVRTEAPVVLGPPLRGGRWAALYDPALPRGHRTTIYTLEGRARIPAATRSPSTSAEGGTRSTSISGPAASA